MKTPLIFIVISFALGIVASEIIKIDINLLFILSVFFILLAFITLSIKYFAYFVLIAVFLSGILIAEIAGIIPPEDISNFLKPVPEKALALGMVITDPEYIFENDFLHKKNLIIKKASFLLKLDSAKLGEKEFKTNGIVYVNAWKSDIAVKYGDIVILEGKIFPLDYQKNENQEKFNFKKYFSRKGIRAFFKIGSKDAIIVIDNKASWVKKIIFNLRHGIEKRIFEYFPKDYAELLRAMILGIRYGFDDEIEEKFVKTGTVHILAISGMNVGMILFIIMIMLQIIRVPRKLKYITSIIVIGFFMIFSGAKPPVVRATIMAEIFLMGLILGRGNSSENALFISGFAMLLYDPLQIFDPSFQLSFASLTGIVYIVPKINSFLIKKPDGDPKIFGKIKYNVLMTLSLTIGAIVGVEGLVVYYFNIISPIGILSNIFIVPIVFFITASGIVSLFFSFVNSFIASAFSEFTSLFIWIMFGLTDILSGVPYGYFETGQISIFWVFFYYLAIFLVFNNKKLILLMKKLKIGLMKN